MRVRTWGRFATALFLSTALTMGALQAPVAQADTAPPVANDPANPETVSAQPLPTVQIGNGVVWSQVVVGNTVYVGGQFSTARPAGSALGTNEVPRSNLLAYDIRTGALIDSWAPATNGVVNVVTAAPDGSRIYVGGAFTTVNGQTRRRIAALNPTTGAIINAFNPNPDASVRAIAVTPTKVYFGGLFGTAGGQSRSRLAAANVDGTLLPWAPVAAGGLVASMAVTPDDGRVIVGGQFTTINGSGNPGYGLAALDGTSGALTPFAAAGLIRNGGANSGINSITVDQDSIYVTGFHFGSGGNQEGVARINLDGTLNWLEDCHGDTYSAFASRGAVYKVGHAHYCGNVPGGFHQSDPWQFRRGMAFSKQATGVLRNEYLGYFNWGGTKSPSILQWLPQLDAGTFTGQTQAAWNLSGNDDYLVAGGEFARAEGMNQQGLVRYARNTPQTPAVEPPEFQGAQSAPIVTSPASGEALISWQTNSDLDNRALTYKVIRGSAVNSPIYTVTRESSVWDRPYLSFVDTGRTPGSTESYRIFATDANGNESRSSAVNVVVSGTGAPTDAYARSVLADGPQNFWRLNESSGTSVADFTGRDPMTTSGTVTRGAGGAVAGDAAATFAGTSTSTAASSTPQHGAFWFTVEAWFRTNTTRGGRIVGFSGARTGTSAANQYDRNIYMSNSGQLNFGVHQGGTRATVTSAANYNNNQWHHVVGVVGDTGMSLYVDGAKVGTRADARTGRSYTGYWRLGGDTLSGWSNRPTSDYFSGSVDEVAVYRHALTGNAVRAHYQAAPATLNVPTDAYGKSVYDDGPELFWRLDETSGTTAADASLNGNSGAFLNSPVLNEAGAFGSASNRSVATDGTNDNIANNVAVSAPPVYSEELWFKTTTTRGGKLIGFGNARTGTSTTSDRHIMMTNAGKLRFGVLASGAESSIESASSYNDGTWHHVVATQGPGGQRLYVDGQEVGSSTVINAANYTGYWRVGGDNLAAFSSRPTSDYFNGAIDEVAVYERVLSKSDVQSHHSKGGGVAPNSPPTASFTHTSSNNVASFDATGSTDADGSIASYSWDFGDGDTSAASSPVHPYAAAGTYQVQLTVTDNVGATSSITKSVTVEGPNAAPTAAFTSTVNGLVASFNSSGSADTDGTIASRSWDFGDNTSGSGVSPDHTYTSAGTFNVTLTVTDDDGATASVTQAVTTTGPPAGPVTYASDDFGRTVANGWGNAVQGGPWTRTGTASNFGVSNGTGFIIMPAAGQGPTSRLGTLASTDTDSTVTVKLDKIGNGGGTLVALGARQIGNSGYRAKVKVAADGRLTLTLVRTIDNADTTLSTFVLPATATLTPGAELNIRLQAQGTGPTAVRARIWLGGTAEPATWQTTATDSNASLQAPGGVILTTYASGSTTNAPVTASFDGLTVTQLLP